MKRDARHRRRAQNPVRRLPRRRASPPASRPRARRRALLVFDHRPTRRHGRPIQRRRARRHDKFPITHLEHKILHDHVVALAQSRRPRLVEVRRKRARRPRRLRVLHHLPPRVPLQAPPQILKPIPDQFLLMSRHAQQQLTTARESPRGDVRKVAHPRRRVRRHPARVHRSLSRDVRPRPRARGGAITRPLVHADAPRASSSSSSRRARRRRRRRRSRSFGRRHG